ncbi:PKD domain-containing protein, partial [Patescibacteria group bacterium]|nr:PKD domain-containing protein [Patescibacteria group bacterium]
SPLPPTSGDFIQSVQHYLTTPYVYFSIPTSASSDSEITFDASSSFSANGIVKYLWDFGDGTTTEEMIVKHKYDSPGRYTVTLTITDSTGKTSTKTQTIDVNPPKPTVDSITADGTDLIIKGKSYPKTIVHLEVHSNPLSVQTDTNEKSEWTYKVADASNILEKGDHTVLAKAVYVLEDKTELTSESSKTYDFKVSVEDGKLKVEMGKTKTWKIVSFVLGGIIIIGLALLVLRRKRRGIRNSGAMG